MEQKIIRVFPLPVTQVTEEETIFVDQVTENAVAARALPVAAAAELTGTKALNYTAATINDKLGHVNSYATATFTSDSYVPAILLAIDSNGESKIDAIFEIVPYGDYTGDGNGLPSAIVNLKLWTKNGQVQTRKLSCIAGKIDTSKFEILVCTNTQINNRHAVFIKSNGFRGFMYVRELSLDLFNTSVYMYTIPAESASLTGWYSYQHRYDNVASEVIGFTKQFAIRIYRMPTSESDLMGSLFPNNNGPDGVFDLYDAIKSNIPVTIVLTGVSSDILAITTNTDIEYDDSNGIMLFDLSFLDKGKSYHLRFALGDDGTPYPGYESVTIKVL